MTNYFGGLSFGNSREFCHHCNTPYYNLKPIRKVKLCPCGRDKGCPLCGEGTITLAHKCKFIRVQR